MLLENTAPCTRTRILIFTDAHMTNPDTAQQQGLQTPNAENRYELSEKDLPLHCPLPGSSLWNSHPRVFIPIEETGFGKCPYCGAEYTLKR